MNEITIDISLDTPRSTVVSYEQYEENFRDIVVRVVNADGTAYDLSAYSARIAGYKPDQHLVYRTGTIVANTIYIDVSQQMTAVASTTGYALNLVLISADKRETLVTILLKVKAAAVQDAEIISTDDINVLDNITAAQLAEIQTFVAETYKTSEWAAYKTAAETAASAASASALSASGSASAASTSTGQASTSATQAAASATSASDSASAASTSASQAADSATAAEQSATNANTAKTDAQAARDATITARTGAETARDAAVTAKTAAEAARDRTITESESIYTIQHAPPMASLYTAIILETPTLGVL